MAEFKEIMKIKRRMCDDRLCKNCPLSHWKNGEDKTCFAFMELYPEEVERICLEWDKENPKITNSDKFFEIFGYHPVKQCAVSTSDCPLCKTDGSVRCADCQYTEFWDKPYVELKER